MQGVLQHVPLQALVVLPLAALAELAAHEQQLLARMAPHVAQQQAQVGELLALVPGHAPEQGALAVHHLVVGQGQHEVLGEGVPDAESELIVVMLAIDGIPGEVAQGVVHPAHVPFHAEAQATGVGRARYHGPGGGFLGHHLDVRMGAVGGLVQAAQEMDGGNVLLAAVFVGDPFARLTAVIQVEHGGHGIHAQTVHVVAVQPEQGAGEQEGAHLVAAVIEDVAVPLGVIALLGIGMLEQVGAVEVCQAVLVAGEMGRHPVEDDAYALLMQAIHQVHEVLGCAVARRGREIARRLVAPGAEEGMLGHGQQLDVGEPHVLDITRQLLRQLPIAQGAVVFLGHAAPGTEVYLVHGEGRVQPVRRAPPAHPVVVVPLVVEAPQARRGLGRRFPEEGEGIALVHPITVETGKDAVLVIHPRRDARDEAFPDAGAVAARRQPVALGVPVVEVADHRHAFGVGRPHGEVRPLPAPALAQVGAQLLVQPAVAALPEQVDVVRGYRARVMNDFADEFHDRPSPLRWFSGTKPRRLRPRAECAGAAPRRACPAPGRG